MELLFATLGGIILGLFARYSVKGSHSHGALLVPAIGGAAAAIVWSALTWAGLKFDAGWIWVFTLVIAAVVSIASAITISRLRVRNDFRLHERLSRS